MGGRGAWQQLCHCAWQLIGLPWRCCREGRRTLHRSSRLKRCSKQREERRGGGVEYSSRCCALCAGAALLPAQNAYNKFHTFLLRLPVSPPLTGKCAQLQGSHDLLLLLQRKSWSTLRLVRALHLICILGLPPRCRGEATGTAWLGSVGCRLNRRGAAATKGHLWHPAVKATLPPPAPCSLLSPAQLAVTFPLCFNRLLSVSLNAGKRVFYVPCKRESEWRKEECWFEGGEGRCVPARCLAT